MRRYTIHALLVWSILSMVMDDAIAFQRRDPAKWVNPFIGTDGHGHTFPGATSPFGMVQLSPDTRVSGWDACAGYHWSDTAIMGFSHTHLSGTGVADLGDILVTPLISDAFHSRTVLHPGELRLVFRHEDESATPGYYSVMIPDERLKVELTASSRVGIHRYSYPAGDTAILLFDLHHGLGPDSVLQSFIRIVGDGEIEGYRRSQGWAKDQHLYFVAQFSRRIVSTLVYLNDSLHSRVDSISGHNIKIAFVFLPSAEPLVAKVALSSVGCDGARRNLITETGERDFDAIRSAVGAEWSKELGKIEARGGSPAQLTTFYTALYHTMIAPNIFSDVDGRYRGMDGKIHTAVGFNMHTVFSLWDTFRAEHPLMTIIDQKRTLDFIKSLLSKYDEGGVLPVWELDANETWCMIGYHSIPVIVDAYAKGIRGFDARHAYDAMTHSAMLDHFGLKAYREHGYSSSEIDAESVSKTLEYSYDDWCIARMAEALGITQDGLSFDERAQFCFNLFDPETKFFRPKNNGAWLRPFDASAVTVHYTEATPWQDRFFVPHDLPRLISAVGGRDAFARDLDSLFGESSEMTGRKQADISGLIGQYAHGNEPSHHVAYLYNYAGEPWKTQATVRLIMDSLYDDRPGGLCGNDDCGQMSAWYVLSAMGFYPVTPGRPFYDIGSPLFPDVTIHLENGRSFRIVSDNNSALNRFVREARLNGKPLRGWNLPHDEIMRGGKLVLHMTPDAQAVPLVPAIEGDRFPRQPITMVPFVVTPQRMFRDSTTFELQCPTPDAKIFYTLDGNVPDMRSALFSEPVTLKRTTTLNAVAMNEGSLPSRIVTAQFVQHIPVGTISLRTKYSFQYTGGGNDALIDGQFGGEDYRNEAWQGYEGIDLDVVIDLQTQKEISKISLGCLQDNNSWVFFPEYVLYAFSNDSLSFTDSMRVENTFSPSEMTVTRKEFSADVKNVKARYVHVVAKNIGVCPAWHKGAGNKAWLFADEIIIQ